MYWSTMSYVIVPVASTLYYSTIQVYPCYCTRNNCTTTSNSVVLVPYQYRRRFVSFGCVMIRWILDSLPFVRYTGRPILSFAEMVQYRTSTCSGLIETAPMSHALWHTVPGTRVRTLRLSNFFGRGSADSAHIRLSVIASFHPVTQPT
jgi:hypothetical protein